MELEGVQDLEAVQARYVACMHRENHDRPLLHLTAPKGERVASPAAAGSLEQQWLDFEWRIDCCEAAVANTHYEAEGVPTYFCNLGPDITAAYLGAELILAESTTWVKPLVEDWNSHPPLRFDRDNRWWRATEEFLKLSVERGRGKWLTATGDLHGNADLLSALRGPQTFCLDVLMEPETVRGRLEEAMAVWKETVDRHCAIIQPGTDGLTSSWLSVALRGRYAVLQNDFSCMVGPETFNDLFLEFHRREAASLDYAIYHWDGPGAIPHRDALCSIEGLNGIQWTPGAGQPPMREWIGLLREVQARGKGLYLVCDPEDVLPLVKALSPEGVIIHASVPSPEDAKALVREVESVRAANLSR